jgi:UDP-N-acetyl-D-mannosaminuronate dehydrogenase
VLVLGAGYKRDLGDARESPSIQVMKLLVAAGCTVFYHDPYVPELNEDGVALKSIELTEAMLRAQDLVVVATDHSHVDYDWVVQHSRHVLDTRRATRAVTRNREKITLL